VGDAGAQASLDDYLRDRIAQLHSIGGTVQQAFGNIVEGGGATLHGTVTLGDANSGVLGVFEHLALDEGGSPHREKYGYQCLHRDQFLFRYDFDPIQHPDMPYHKHLPQPTPPTDGRRIPWSRVTLQDVVDEFWPIVVERDAEEAAAEVETESEI
jgi:hypothetical protein